MARDAGVLAILTLTGEASAADAASLPTAHRPDLVVSDLDSLAGLLREAFASRLEGGQGADDRSV
jgi:phosphoglycolate phosphatase-like HAD superfamily hydrolase